MRSGKIINHHRTLEIERTTRAGDGLIAPKINRRQLRATSKGHISEIGHALPENRIGQILATVEGIITDGDHAVGNADAAKSQAIAESGGLDIGDAVWNHDAGQALAQGK